MFINQTFIGKKSISNLKILQSLLEVLRNPSESETEFLHSPSTRHVGPHRFYLVRLLRDTLTHNRGEWGKMRLFS